MFKHPLTPSSSQYLHGKYSKNYFQKKLWKEDKNFGIIVIILFEFFPTDASF